MAKKLLITEKPSVAMEFAKALKITTQRNYNLYMEKVFSQIQINE